MAARSNASVCGRSPAGIGGFESHQGHGCLSIVRVACFQVGVSATGRSLVQKTPTDCGMFFECERKISIMRRPLPIGGLKRHGGKIYSWFES